MPAVTVVVESPALREAVRHACPPSSPDCEIDDRHLLVVELTGSPMCKGAEAVRALRLSDHHAVVIAICGADSAAVTQQAVRLGVDDFFRLPEEGPAFRAATTALLNRTAAKPPIDQHALLGDSAHVTALRKYIARVALTNSNVLITGETGTGKELVAGMIHKGGARRNRPFVCVNSAALPEALLESELFGYEKGAFTGAHRSYPGRLRMAHGGTIFFDEVGDLSLASQAKVLRALESGEVQPLGGWRSVSIDTRVIAATNQDLDAMTRARTFREDLYYRLNVVRIELPPLRSRREDIPQLLEHFVGVFNAQSPRQIAAFQPDAVALLQGYDWPGNIRELRNVVEASFVNATTRSIGIADLPPRLRRPQDGRPAPDDRAQLMGALLSANWNITRVADVLQCSRMTVYRKMAHFQISR